VVCVCVCVYVSEKLVGQGYVIVTTTALGQTRPGFRHRGTYPKNLPDPLGIIG